MAVGHPWLLLLLLAACCACCAFGVRMVKRRERTSREDCEWERTDYTFSNGLATDPDTSRPVLDKMNLVTAQSRCLEIGSSCQAVTCASAGGNTCTLRATAVLMPSAGENSWVPSCHACISLAGIYWGIDTKNNTNYQTSLTQEACNGELTVSQNGFPVVTRSYQVSGVNDEGGGTVVSWDYWRIITKGGITGYPGAYSIAWEDGFTSMQCPWVNGVYETSGGGFTPSQIMVTQTAGDCRGTRSPIDDPFQTTDWWLLPGFKIGTTNSGVESKGNLGFDPETGFWKVTWGEFMWQQLDESTTNAPALYR